MTYRRSWGTHGTAVASSAVTFVPTAALEDDVQDKIRGNRDLVEAKGMRDITKQDLKHNTATPKIEVDPQTYEIRLDGEVVKGSSPLETVPLGQKFFLF